MSLTSGQLTILQSELTNDPLNLGFAALKPLSPGLVANTLNALNYTTAGSITSGILLGWLAQTTLMGKVWDTAYTSTSPFYGVSALRSAAIAMLVMLQASVNFALDTTPVGTANLAMLQGWVDAGAITSDQKAALVALAQVPASRATMLGLPSIVEADVHSAWGI